MDSPQVLPPYKECKAYLRQALPSKEFNHLIRWLPRFETRQLYSDIYRQESHLRQKIRQEIDSSPSAQNQADQMSFLELCDVLKTEIEPWPAFSVTDLRSVPFWQEWWFILLKYGLIISALLREERASYPWLPDFISPLYFYYFTKVLVIPVSLLLAWDFYVSVCNLVQRKRRLRLDWLRLQVRILQIRWRLSHMTEKNSIIHKVYE